MSLECGVGRDLVVRKSLDSVEEGSCGCVAAIPFVLG